MRLSIACRADQRSRTASGFTLVELAVVLGIIGVLLASLLLPLGAQVEQRQVADTTRRLEDAREALIGFAIVNGRLPCPATAGTTGDESPAGGGNCTTDFGGLLPARTIGLQPVDAQGYALDVWGNRIRYAVARSITGCTGSSTLPHFTSQVNLKTNGVSCLPNDLDVCAPVDTTTACTAANRVVSPQTVAFLVFSTGKNGAVPGSYGPHETANLDANSAFVGRTPSGADAVNGAYDDAMLWVPVGVFYGRLIAAGVLP
jgi:prepilin-type N-terminal cleavage/methylation domain-containing protein